MKCTQPTEYELEHVLDYYPYGKILRQFVNDDGPEKHLTTQHERDQETGLDYRGARYYDSDVARFLSLDPAQAEYPSMSPYNYVGGNPITFIDPTGRNLDKYEVGDDGAVRLVEKNNNNYDELVGTNSQGKQESLILTDRTILPQLAGEPTVRNGRSGAMITNYAFTSNEEAAASTFMFMANHSSVEWALNGYAEGSSRNFVLGTSRNDDSVEQMDRFCNPANKIFDLHSHPGPNGESSKDLHFGNLGSGITGDMLGAYREMNAANKDGRVAAPRYVYHQPSQGVYSYDAYQSNVFKGCAGNSCDLMNILP